MFDLEGIKMRNYDEVLKNLINEKTIDIIIQIIKDYLSLLES